MNVLINAFWRVLYLILLSTHFVLIKVVGNNFGAVDKCTVLESNADLS